MLSAALRQAAAGDARLALVSGEPGIGKTELARAFARAAAKDGALVLWGSAWEEGGAPPYWPWVQVLRSYARQAGPEALADAAGPQAAVLGPAPARARPRPRGHRLRLRGQADPLRGRLRRPGPGVTGRPAGRDPRRPARRRASLSPAAALRGGRAAVPDPAARHLPNRRGRPDPDVSDVIAALESVSPPLVLAGLSAADIGLMLPGADADVLAAVQRRSPAGDDAGLRTG